MNRGAEVVELLAASSWFVARLTDVAALDLPDWWIGAGAIRDLVWDERFGRGFDPASVKDVDVVFFDASDLGREREHGAEEALARRDPNTRWDVTNQAGVHTWFPARFGMDVAPLHSSLDGVATWPEYATCVAATLDTGGNIRIAAPHGVDDLLDGVWRRNPVRVTVEEYERRLAKKDPARRWPGVQVVPVA